jgi:hypothetical protein
VVAGLKHNLLVLHQETSAVAHVGHDYVGAWDGNGRGVNSTSIFSVFRMPYLD